MEKSTLGCDGVEGPRTIEGYGRDRAGYFDRDGAGHGNSTSLPVFPRRTGRGSVVAGDRCMIMEIDHRS